MLLELFLVFLKLGAFTIGGGIAMIPILNDAMVEEKKWFSQDEMTDILAICQSLPGVIAINMATYVGFKKKGFLGSLVATIGVLLPSFVIILAIAMGLDFLQDNPIAEGAMAGLRAASAGLVLFAVWQIAKSAIKKTWQLLAAILCFVLIVAFDISIVWIVLSYLVIGVGVVIVNDKAFEDADGRSDRIETNDGADADTTDDEKNETLDKRGKN